MPVQLAVLGRELRGAEQGVWLNLRHRTSGIVELVHRTKAGKSYLRPRRVPLPLFAAAMLEQIYEGAGVEGGCPELVIWTEKPEGLRLVDVRGPDWVRVRSSRRVARERFTEAAGRLGVSTSIVQWEFQGSAA